MRKLFLVIAVVFMLLFTLQSCESSTENGKNNTNTDASVLDDSSANATITSSLETNITAKTWSGTLLNTENPCTVYKLDTCFVFTDSFLLEIYSTDGILLHTFCEVSDICYIKDRVYFQSNDKRLIIGPDGQIDTLTTN